MAAQKYLVTVEQLNRINPVTLEAEPLKRGDTLDLDPTSADARRWLEGNCILLVPAVDAPDTGSEASATASTEATGTAADGADATGQHSAPDQTAATKAKAGAKAPAGSTGSVAPDADSGQGVPVS